ncbi:hypothetical protein LR48_Vigan470s000300 [Vigna angularis]|uniref:Bowman-Birk serine protease inhibitors family domain-containing protein n=2 Tax=Phaseolus angularis TaxID=3914 RepID=A0A0L9TBI5_PHAAN|nr:hypothetical protein LR48_Vigan470s000300 [Vigna angularis]BAT83644.1 hypothetical protein VIGAN_04082800 [Vigna angularis var. angularis]
MELKVMMKVSLMLFFIIFSATTAVDARFDPTLFHHSAEKYVKSTDNVCCDKCVCRNDPPKCQCYDIVENSCHSACDFCICATSEPPQCRCMDQNSFCYAPCTFNQ